MQYPLGGRRAAAQPTRRRFNEYFRCYPVGFMPGNPEPIADLRSIASLSDTLVGPERENVNYGGKVIMPPSALEKLTRLHISYPMLFELRNGAKERVSHAGVLEFIAAEGRIYLPHWVSSLVPITSSNDSF